MPEEYRKYLKDLMKDIYDGIDRDWMMKNTIDLWKIELPQTWTAYTAAADHTEELLKAEGFDVVVFHELSEKAQFGFAMHEDSPP